MKSLLLSFLIMGFASVGLAQPDTNAPAPEDREAENVISIYSAAYDNISGINFDPNWGQSGHQQVDPEYDPGTGQFILAYPNFNYQGTEFPAFNASGMEYLHVSIWVPEGTSRMVKVTPIDDTGETLVEVPLTPGEWNSVDLPKDAFTGMTWQNVIQLKFDGQFNADGSGNTTPFDVYLDNVFFWKEASSAEDDATLSDLQVDGETIDGFDPNVFDYTYELTADETTPPQITLATTTNPNATSDITQADEVPGDATVVVVSENGENERTYTVSYLSTIPTEAPPQQPAINPDGVISILSDAYDDIEVDAYSAVWDDSDIEFVEVGGATTMRIDFGNFVGVDFSNNKQDMSDMTHFHIDFYTGNDSFDKSFNLKLSNFGGTDAEVNALEYSITMASDPPIADGEWVTVDVPLDEWSPVNGTDRSDVAQFIISSNLDVVYVANIYAYNASDVSTETTESPNRFELQQNYPNPFNPTTNITYSIPNSGDVTLEVFNLVGQKVATLVDGVQTAGSHTQSFDATNLSSGVYLYRLGFEGTVQTRQMMLIK